MAGDQCSALPVGHRHRQTTDCGRHHRGAAGLRFDGHQSEGLRIARNGQQVCRPVHVHQLVPGLRRQEAHAIGDTEFGRQSNQGVGGGQAAAGGPAHDQHPRSRRQQSRRAQQHVGCLERLDAPDERNYPLSCRQPQGGTRPQPVTGAEGL